METISRTNRDILRFMHVSAALLGSTTEESKLTYALKRVRKEGIKLFEEYDAELTEININHGSENEKGNLLPGPNGFVFTKEEAKQQQIEHRKLLDREVEIGIYFARKALHPITKKEIPFELTGIQREAFEGFVIPEVEEPSDEVVQEASVSNGATGGLGSE